MRQPKQNVQRSEKQQHQPLKRWNHYPKLSIAAVKQTEIYKWLFFLSLCSSLTLTQVKRILNEHMIDASTYNNHVLKFILKLFYC